MNPTFTFTPDDMMHPVYCKQCRTHIPLVILTQGNGICPDCIQADQQAQTAAFQQQQVIQAQRVAAMQAAQQRRADFLKIFAPNIVTVCLFAILIFCGVAYHNKVVTEMQQKIAKLESRTEKNERILERTTKLAENADKYAHSHPNMHSYSLFP